MKRRGMVSALAAALVIIVSTTRTSAFLGVGDVVFDPSVYAQMVEQLIRMEKQYEQLIRSYATLREQYTHMVQMARTVPVDMAQRYRVSATRWQPFAATDTYGAATNWNTTINTGHALADAYSAITEPLQVYGKALGVIPVDQVARVKRGYGAIELTDAANVNALGTIGGLRGNAPSVERTIQQLEDDSFSSQPEMNTEIAVLNKINAASVIALRGNQDTNKLLVALAEPELLRSTIERDARARAVNQQIRFLSEGPAVAAAQSSGASEAMLNWRLP